MAQHGLAPIIQAPDPWRPWRWGAVVWMAVWTPAYALTWGWRSFFALCDVAAALTCLGLWSRSRLLVSSQALPSLMVGALWCADVGSRLVAGRHVFGGTEYMWQGSVPL